ncbi:LPS translocon maturation chaperone LptM [Chitiniphilus shinanonensis]|uniref:LPS translocon maturation chaperone LptM n=1 Tax=Chitiniphilus shinanonensis TaxID=553088 RepID=UPI00333E2A24
MRALLPLLFVLGFAGCGFKGPLYLPPQDAKAVKPKPAAPSPAAIEGATSAPAVGELPPEPGLEIASVPSVHAASAAE